MSEAVASEHETLARLLNRTVHERYCGTPPSCDRVWDCDGALRSKDARLYATALLNSDWLAEHDRALKGQFIKDWWAALPQLAAEDEGLRHMLRAALGQVPVTQL